MKLFSGQKLSLVAAVTALGLMSEIPVAHAHPGARVEMELETSSPASAGRIRFAFELVDNTQRKAITASDLEVTHEKLLHVFIFDAALKEFSHVHPDFVDGQWVVEVDLPVSGSYSIWAQGQLAADHSEFATEEQFTVTGGTAANSTPPVLGEVKVGAAGISQVSLGYGRLHAGSMAMVMLNFSHTDGSAPALTPYLGAMAHIVAVSSDSESLLHVHPMNGSGPNDMMIHTEFPAVGEYRIWVQFIDGGVLKTVPLSVSVQ